MPFSSDQMISLRRFAKAEPLELVHGRLAAYVAGPSAEAVRRVTAAYLANVEGAVASVPQKVGLRYIARLPRRAVRFMPFLPWVVARPTVVTSSTELALLRLIALLRAQYGAASFVAPRLSRTGKWVLVLPSIWSRANVHVEGTTYLRPAGSTTQGVPNQAGQISICGPDEEIDLDPSSPTFGECVIAVGGDDDVISPTTDCGPGQHFDEFLVTCVCDDPAAMVGPNGQCVLAPCPPGSHHEAGICVPDTGPPGPGGGGTTVTPKPPPPTPVPTDTGSGLDEDTMLLIGGGIVTVAAIGLGIYLARKKKGKRKR